MPDHSRNFWNFSVELYACERVADACLDLQNSYGIDVNLLLFCYWHGRYHGEFAATTLEQSLEYSTTWKQEVVQPLRNVRQWMKANAGEYVQVDQSQYETLRARVKFDELAAEKYQQEALEQIALANVQQTANVDNAPTHEKNLERLFSAIGLDNNDLIQMRLKTIAKAMEKLF